MLGYIADKEMSNIIERVCKKNNILILDKQENETDLNQYCKETKINFKLIKYLIIDLNLIKNDESEIIKSIYNLSTLYASTRIIILAPEYEDNSAVLNGLYDMEIYNIINDSQIELIEEKINIALSKTGLTKKDSIKFKRVENEIKQKNKFSVILEKFKSVIVKARDKVEKLIKHNKNKIKKEKSETHQIDGVYFFDFFKEVTEKTIKFVYKIIIWGFAFIGMTTLFNAELRHLLEYIIGLGGN